MSHTSPDSKFPAPTKACPYCGEQILAVAVKCKHCGSDLARSGGARKPQWPGIVMALLAFFVLAITNPTKSDFSEFLAQNISERSGAETSKSGLDALGSGIAIAAVTQMTNRSNFLLFSLFEIDASPLRAFGKNASNRKFLGIAGAIIPLGFTVSQNSSGKAAKAAAEPTENRAAIDWGAERARFEETACSVPIGHNSEKMAHRSASGTMRIVSADDDGTMMDVACLDHQPISVNDAAQYISIEKAFSLYSFEFLGIRFGEKTVYLLDTATGGTIDGSITASCAFITISGKGKFEILREVECPTYREHNGSNEAAMTELSDFQVAGNSIRFMDRNPAGYAASDDIGEFEFRDGQISTIKPWRSDESYRSQFASLTPEDIVQEALEDGRWAPGDEEIHLSCGACAGYSMNYCFKYESIRNAETTGPYAMILERSCEYYLKKP